MPPRVRQLPRRSTFTDDDIACAIIAAATAQTESIPASGFAAEALARSLQHILLLLRLRRIHEHSKIPEMLNKLEKMRFKSLQRELEEEENEGEALTDGLKGWRD